MHNIASASDFARRLACVMLPMLLAVGSGRAMAADYPSRPVTIVVPFVAGSATDVFARILAEGLRKELNAPFVVEARPGGGMAIGANYVARSANDGYTLFLAPAASVTLNEVVNPALPYRGSDFAPIGLLAVVPQVLTVRGDLPVHTVKELAEYAKARPGEVTLGNGGANTLTQIMAKILEQDLGVKFNHIPFNGSTAARTSMLAKQIDAAMDIIAGLPALQEAGKLRALAVLASREHPALPGVKTFTELGFQHMDREGWFGLMAPKGTPPDVIARLNAATKIVLTDPQVVKRVIAMGLLDHYSSTAEFAEVLDKDVKAWRAFVAANPVAK
jgi:tripartite-type tricarboxylate transporter receptor subunit TctC